MASSQPSAPRHAPRPRAESNVSDASFYSQADGVEMSQEDVFSGPITESVPSSVSAFAHRRRSRTESNASFTFFQQDEVENWDNEEAIEDGDDDDFPFDAWGGDIEIDVEAGSRRHSLARSPRTSRDSQELPLLDRQDTNATDNSRLFLRGPLRSNQKIYILTEDLSIIVGGFRTSKMGSAIVSVLSVLTLGLFYLMLRWAPRWRVRLTGKPCPLRDCEWVVIENEWNEFSIHPIRKRSYGMTLSTVFGPPSEKAVAAAEEAEEDDDPILNHLRYLDYRYIRFSYNPIEDKFMLATNWKDPEWDSVLSAREGVDNDQRDQRASVFGPNVIDIEEKSTTNLFLDEVFHPFYVFQIASIILWSMDEYYYYATCIFLISVVSITSTLIETKSTMKRLREISRFICDVRVLRNGYWEYVSSSDLVPGDVYEVTDPNLTLFPCDSILLSGDCIVNESMLTGESVPVSKVPCTDEALQELDLGASSVKPALSKYFLFCGTKIIRARRPQEGEDDEAVALALVVRTGFNTTKGALVRSMLFPKPTGFKFYRDSFYYISVMAAIALLGFIASFIRFIELGMAWHLIVVRALDLITIVVPPALPATLTIGTNFALARLKNKKIFCISPMRVNVAGKLDVVCFDKTGTLTEDGLDVLGVRAVQRNTNRFSEIYNDSLSLLPPNTPERDLSLDFAMNKAILHTMATCHSLRLVDGELIGDPLDQKMFAFTGWSYEETGSQVRRNSEEILSAQPNAISPPVVRPPPGKRYGSNEGAAKLELGVFKSFEFVSQLRRASVIVKQFGESGCDIYVKGAPECMADICKSGSFPEDYDDQLAHYTHRGFRVIACATKSIKKLSWVKAQKMKREEAEKDLDFCGFIIFENKLKPSTAGVMKELRQANLRKVMCTGDNILTAISVARECELIDKTAHVFVPHFVEGDAQTATAKIQWESVDNKIYKLDENTLHPLPAPPEGDLSLPYDISNMRNYSVAVSGEVFRWMVDFAPREVLHRMLVIGQVFARMSPDEKHELVEKLQSLDYTVCFCGDGANDCGALKAADVGISLSEAEASVAAPFTSRVFEISCVPTIIREGRASLTTSFSCFKYMSLYSAIQFTSVSILYKSGSNLGDFEFLFIDLLLILPIAIFMSWSDPADKLSVKRPTASLVSRKVLTPLLGQMAICLLVQMAVYSLVQEQPWYIPPVVDPEKSNILNSQNTSLFLVSCYQYILSSLILSVGPPFRKPMLQNIPYIVTIVISMAIVTYLLVAPAKSIMDFMQLTEMSASFKGVIVLLSAVGFTVSWFGEKKVFLELARWIEKTAIVVRPSLRKKRKEYKVLEDEMRV
ncbi:hypothetical protein DRE_06196 [Drechslerella stenobrocha 248]|uniref:Cation-transporting ATPase n=1 Tax=Drechslerella stenobrocha 248 TaxID=1043628 RepID=W7HY52_9PEZI|nr:hypothetical protein DRE_06196 [Drechslerella stenobrocha 248]